MITKKLNRVYPVGSVNAMYCGMLKHGYLLFLLLILTLYMTLPAQGQFSVPNFNRLAQTPTVKKETPVVKIEVVPQYSQVGFSQKFALAVVLDVPEGWHLYANPRLGDFGIDTEITPQATEGLEFGGVIYPPGKKYIDKYLGASNHIYKGKAICLVPVEVSALKEGPIPLRLELKGLLCSATNCIPWSDQVDVEIQVVQAPTQAKPNRPELFGDFQAAAVRDDKTEPISSSDNTIAAGDWVKPLLLALLAGLIMNLMPCVLPIIPIVIMTLVKQCAPKEGEEHDRGKSIKVGLAFAGGIMIVFAGLAVLTSVFKFFWGQQFQSSEFKFVLLMVVYVLSLSMFGMFEIVLPSKISNITILRKGYLGALAMGMLATILATPCGAPLLAPVLTWSLSKSQGVTMGVFLITGMGMAIPYVLLTAFPKLLSRVPKAGNWMIILKQVIGFAMLAFSVHLINLFPPSWHSPLMYFCLVLGFCVWLGLFIAPKSSSSAKRYIIRGLALIILAGASVTLAITDKQGPSSTSGQYWLDQLNDYQQQGQTAMVKFTANYCISCAVLDKLIYKKQKFRDKLIETNAVLIIADDSYGDPEIKQMIRELAGVGQALPFAAVFPGGDSGNPILLRDFYSMKDTLGALDKAAQSKIP